MVAADVRAALEHLAGLQTLIERTPPDDPYDSLYRGDAPLPLSERQARLQAVRLRKRNPRMSYRVIADVIRTYHGISLTEAAVRYECGARGAPKRPMTASKRAQVARIHELRRTERKALIA